MLYREEWDFIKEYYLKYKEVPPEDVFFGKFDSFEQYNTDGDIMHYIDELHKWKARHVLQELITTSAQSLKDVGPFATINNLNKELAQLGRDTRLVRDLDLVNNAQERIDNLRERIEMVASGRKLIGISSGIDFIDEHFGGWQKGDLVVIAAWTGQLKSYLALLFSMNAWLEGYRVLYFSLEMSGLQVGYRFDTLLSGKFGSGFTNTGLTHANSISFDAYKTWLGEIMYNKHPFVVVTNEELEEINQNTVLAKIEQWKPDLVVCDYHQLFDDASGAIGETEKTKNLSKAFKRIAIRTGVPIIDVTSVTMKGDHGERPPTLDEMAWSKQLAFDSDLTLALCKHGDMLEVLSRKNRRGPEIKGFLNWEVNSGVVKEIERNYMSKHIDNDEEDDE